MTKSSSKKLMNEAKLFSVILVTFVLLFAGSAIAIRQVYNSNLQPVGGEKKTLSLTIEPGSTPSDIALNLKNKGLIKSDWAFEWYVRNHQLREKLQAGTYIFSTDQDIATMADTIAKGKVASDLFTILPGKRIDQLKKDFVKAGFSVADVESAFDPANYKGHPALSDLPQNATLEGYIYPESYQKTASTKASTIVKSALDEMASQLTPERRQEFSKKGLSAYQAITLASIVEKEVSNKKDKPQVAQVFLKRKEIGMNLGSDVTAFYATALAGVPDNVTIDSPYNTRIKGGLPPGPISNMSSGSLEAVAYPASTDWLFFVAGDDGITYFSKTVEEHEALAKKHCIKLCQLP